MRIERFYRAQGIVVFHYADSGDLIDIRIKVILPGHKSEDGCELQYPRTWKRPNEGEFLSFTIRKTVYDTCRQLLLRSEEIRCRKRKAAARKKRR